MPWSSSSGSRCRKSSTAAPKPAPAPAQNPPETTEAAKPKAARDPFEGIIYDDHTADTHWDSSENSTATAPARKAYDLVWPAIDGLTKVRKNGRYGFLDADRREVIPLIYEAAWNFREGLARVRKNGGKYGFIDKTGKEVVPITYDNAEDFKKEFALVQKNFKYGYVDKTGRVVIPLIYDEPNIDGTGQFSRDGYAILKKNDKFGIADTSGNLVVPLEYDTFDTDILAKEYFPNGLACAKKDGKWGYIDTKGKVRIPFQYLKGYRFEFYSERAPVCKKSLMTLNTPKWGYIDKDGKTRIPFRYDDAKPFGDCRRAPVAKDRKWGVIDDYGNQIIPFKYDYIDCFYHGYARVLIDSGSRLWGIIDKSGREIVAPKYDAIFQVPEGYWMDRYFLNEDYPMVKKNGKYGFIDLSRGGKEIAPCVYDFADYFERGFALVRKANREFFIDRDGKEVSFS